MKQAARVVVYNILVTLAIILVLEGASRWIRPVDLPEPLITERRGDWPETRQYDPHLFWTMRPHTLVSELEPLRTNSLGLRGPEIAMQAPQTFRILSLGESTTWGESVQYEETYNRLLETELPAIDGRPVQVINAGVSGYTLFQGLTYLRLHGLNLNPDVVLLYFGYNDFLPVSYRAQREAGPQSGSGGMTDRELFEQRRTLLYRGMYVLQKNSNLARLLLLQTVPAGDNAVLTSNRSRVPEDDRRWVLSELRSMAQEHEFRLVVVIPWYRSFEKHIPLLRELKAWDDVDVVDLPARLSELPETRARFFFDVVHPNREGHRLIAEVIGAHLRNNWSGMEARR